MGADEYLRQFREAQPLWLSEYASGAKADGPGALRAFLKSRTVFYPGSGTDGSPISLFNRARAAHCFIYSDSGLSLAELRKVFREEPLSGYEPVGEILLGDADLEAAGCRPPNSRGYLVEPPVTPFALLVIFGRNPHKGEAHGSDAFAVLFLGWDAFGAFDTLFSRRAESVAPYCVVLQDHGFGGNSPNESFGGGGRLERSATASGNMPEFVLVGDNTDAWTGYAEPHEHSQSDEPVSGWRGGIHAFSRRLLRKL